MSSETMIKVQRLLKLPKVSKWNRTILNRGGTIMETMEGVNHDKRQRGYGARDKEEIIKTIIKLHKEGYSQVGIAKRLNISRMEPLVVVKNQKDWFFH